MLDDFIVTVNGPLTNENIAALFRLDGVPDLLGSVEKSLMPSLVEMWKILTSADSTVDEYFEALHTIHDIVFWEKDK